MTCTCGLEARLRALLDDPVYTKIVVKETPTTAETTRIDPTPLVLVSDIRAALDGEPA